MSKRWGKASLIPVCRSILPELAYAGEWMVESCVALFIYYIILCVLSEVSTIGYLITFIIKKRFIFDYNLLFWEFY